MAPQQAVLPPIRAKPRKTAFQPVELHVPNLVDPNAAAAGEAAAQRSRDPFAHRFSNDNISDESPSGFTEDAPMIFDEEGQLVDMALRQKPGVGPAGMTQMIPFQRLSRDAATKLISDINRSDAATAAHGAPSVPVKGGPALGPAAVAPFAHTRVYTRKVVTKQTTGVIAAIKRRKRSGKAREVTVRSSVDDLKTFRKSMIPPAPILGLLRDEFQEFADVDVPPPPSVEGQPASTGSGPGLLAAAVPTSTSPGGSTVTIAPDAVTDGLTTAAAAATVPPYHRRRSTIKHRGKLEALDATPTPATPAPPAEVPVALNPFSVMCDDVVNALAEFESSMQTFSAWRNDFFKQNVTSGVKLALALMVAKVVRSQSDLAQLILELVRSVRTYSVHWSDKLNAVLELEEEHARQSRAFDAAIRKLENMHGEVLRGKTNRQIFMWEYITKKLLRRTADMEAAAAGGDDDDDTDGEGAAAGYGDANDDDDAEGGSLRSSRHQLGGAGRTATIDDRGSSSTDIRDRKKKPRATSDRAGSDANSGGTSERNRAQNMKALLESKRKEREATAAAATADTQDNALSAAALRDHQFSQLVNTHHPHLARAIYALRTRKPHPPMYYASEILILEAVDADASLNKPAVGHHVLHHAKAWTTDAATELTKAIAPRGLVRSNSTHAVRYLIRDHHDSDFIASHEHEKMQRAAEAMMRAIRSRLPPGRLRFDQILKSKKKSRVAGMVAAAAASDEAVAVPAKAQSVGILDLGGSPIDLSKAWFTLQDVVELSLLHMQQIQQLRDEYEHTVLHLTQLNAQNNVIPRMWQDLPSAPAQEDRATSPHPRDRSRAYSPDTARSPKLSRKSPSSPTRKTPPNRRRSPLRSRPRPVAHSSLLNLTFLDRMTRMAAEAHKKKSDQSEQLSRAEMQINLEKVVRDRNQVFTREQVVEIMEKVLPAVFMPVPEKPDSPAFPSRPASRVVDRFRPRSTPKSDRSIDPGLDLFEIARPLSPRRSLHGEGGGQTSPHPHPENDGQES
ncbi:hypothetical protein BC828DRAFT_378964 [Blastocladiella britannica]|nr:hypothetical protein BC828DRAFT_378964 [Blastocladiella britannica]